MMGIVAALLLLLAANAGGEVVDGMVPTGSFGRRCRVVDGVTLPRPLSPAGGDGIVGVANNNSDRRLGDSTAAPEQRGKDPNWPPVTTSMTKSVIRQLQSWAKPSVWEVPCSRAQPLNPAEKLKDVGREKKNAATGAPLGSNNVDPVLDSSVVVALSLLSDRCFVGFDMCNGTTVQPRGSVVECVGRGPSAVSLWQQQTVDDDGVYSCFAAVSDLVAVYTEERYLETQYWNRAVRLVLKGGTKAPTGGPAVYIAVDVHCSLGQEASDAMDTAYVVHGVERVLSVPLDVDVSQLDAAYSFIHPEHGRLPLNATILVQRKCTSGEFPVFRIVGKGPPGPNTGSLFSRRNASSPVAVVASSGSLDAASYNEDFTARRIAEINDDAAHTRIIVLFTAPPLFIIICFLSWYTGRLYCLLRKVVSGAVGPQRRFSHRGVGAAITACFCRLCCWKTKESGSSNNVGDELSHCVDVGAVDIVETDRGIVGKVHAV